MEGRLPQFRQAVDDPKPYLIPNLHLHHLGRQAGTHALGVFQLELDLSTATFDEMKQQHRRQTLEFFIRRVLAHVEDLRHASRPFSNGHRHLSLWLKWACGYNAPKEGVPDGDEKS
jgi:hypothetical protein